MTHDNNIEYINLPVGIIVNGRPTRYWVGNTILSQRCSYKKASGAPKNGKANISDDLWRKLTRRYPHSSASFPARARAQPTRGAAEEPT
ncbi:hypothetical protein EVAR_15129_1 [Eumeta japonica]|uniref:Uncharacterized protein n=1 Tax=Eumeta variegata TaxID=151549 RepID=A0A4C1UI63_EUMVA|nr:hypothetical protein EVAR_15129_1 [Eumeta japonica]